MNRTTYSQVNVQSNWAKVILWILTLALSMSDKHSTQQGRKNRVRLRNSEILGILRKRKRESAETRPPQWHSYAPALSVYHRVLCFTCAGVILRFLWRWSSGIRLCEGRHSIHGSLPIHCCKTEQRKWDTAYMAPCPFIAAKQSKGNKTQLTWQLARSLLQNRAREIRHSVHGSLPIHCWKTEQGK